MPRPIVLAVFPLCIIPHDNSSIGNVEEFKYLGTTLTDQNSIQEEIKSRLKLGNACYHLVQDLFVFQVAIQKLKDQDI
jgi:hypothetical protein